MTERGMREFWDERAEEDAFFFVDNRLAYGDPDTDRFWASGKEDLTVILDAVGLRRDPGQKLVEIGCGVGRITRALADGAASVRALDVSAKMLELAEAHNGHLKNVEWILGDGTSLAPIPNASADGCFSHVVFQHIPDPLITLGYVTEIARVLRPGGWAVFQISNAPELHRKRPLGARAKFALRSVLGRGPRGQGHPAWLGSSVDLQDLSETAASGRASIERMVGEGTQFCYVLLRKGEPTAAG